MTNPSSNDAENVALARAWLDGYVTERRGYRSKQYLEDEEELRGRRALAELLRTGEVPPDILDLLARSVMPDDEDVYDGIEPSNVLRPDPSRRRLDFRFRKGKDRSRGSNRASDPHRLGSILARVDDLIYQEGLTQTRAFEIVAEEVFLTPDAIRKQWEPWRNATRR